MAPAVAGAQGTSVMLGLLDLLQIDGLLFFRLDLKSLPGLEGDAGGREHQRQRENRSDLEVQPVLCAERRAQRFGMGHTASVWLFGAPHRPVRGRFLSRSQCGEMIQARQRLHYPAFDESPPSVGKPSPLRAACNCAGTKVLSKIQSLLCSSLQGRSQGPNRHAAPLYLTPLRPVENKPTSQCRTLRKAGRNTPAPFYTRANPVVSSHDRPVALHARRAASGDFRDSWTLQYPSHGDI